MSETKTYAATGHRNDKLGGYNKETDKKILETARRALQLLNPDVMITGMAGGWDMAIAQACVELRINYIAAVPFKGQEKMWPDWVKKKYHKLLESADTVHIVSPGEYEPAKMHVRNKWMVDNANAGVLALYNGDESGGTANCIRYAKEKDQSIYNAWRLFREDSDQLTITLSKTHPEYNPL